MEMCLRIHVFTWCGRLHYGFQLFTPVIVLHPHGVILSLMVGGGFFSLDFGLGHLTFLGQWNISGSDASWPKRLDMALPSRACFLVILPLP